MPIPAPHIASLLWLLAFSLPAAAGNWRTVVDTDVVRAEIDMTTLSRNGDIVKIWEKETYRKPEQARLGDFYYKSAKSLAQHHCANRTTAYLFKAYYAEDGREIKAITNPGDLERIDYMPPDSLEEHKLAFACNFRAEAPPRVKSHLPPPLAETPPAEPARKPPAAVKSPEKTVSPASSGQVKTPKPEANKSPSATKSPGGK